MTWTHQNSFKREWFFLGSGFCIEACAVQFEHFILTINGSDQLNTFTGKSIFLPVRISKQIRTIKNFIRRLRSLEPHLYSQSSAVQNWTRTSLVLFFPSKAAATFISGRRGFSLLVIRIEEVLRLIRRELSLQSALQTKNNI